MTNYISSRHLPAEPALACDTILNLQSAFKGPALATVNSAAGLNANFWPCLAFQLDADPALVAVAAANTAEAAVRKAQDVDQKLDDAVVQKHMQLVDETWTWETAHRCAEPTKTGIPDGCLTTLIVDYAQQLTDLPAIVAEAHRVLVPGGLLVCIVYGRPRVSTIPLDLSLYAGTDDGDEQAVRFAVGLKAAMDAANIGGTFSVGKTSTASCLATPSQLLQFMDRGQAGHLLRAMLQGGLADPHNGQCCRPVWEEDAEESDEQDGEREIWFMTTPLFVTMPGQWANFEEPWRSED